MHRIYFDTNSGTPDGRFLLTVRGALQDIARVEDELHDGLRVQLYMTDEVEMEGVLRFDPVWGGWTALPDWGTLRDAAPGG